MIKNMLEKLSNSEDLSREEAAQALQLIIDDQLTATEIGALLFGLRMKGESIGEVLGFTDTMHRNMVSVTLNDPDAIDVCGTGGDQKHSFNISTTAALVVAAGGVTVAKHGNRSVSSRTGSADVLEKLGVKIDLPPEKTKQCVNEVGIGFFFAPLYHPAMKIMLPHRKNLGIRTVFNMLGPLLNPANVKRQLIGTYDLETAKKMADVLRQRGYLKACTVYSDDGFDELSPFAVNHIFEVSIDKPAVNSYRYQPQPCEQNDLRLIQGGDSATNAQITLSVLKGKKGVPRDATVLNAAFGLYVGGKVDTIDNGIRYASELIDDGVALKKLHEFIEISRDMAN